MSIVLDEQAGTIVLETSTGASTQQLSDLPAAGTLDSDDTLPVCVDGVWSLATLANLTVTSGTGGFAVVSGGNSFTGTQSFDAGVGKAVIDVDGSGNTRFKMANEGNTGAYVALAPFAGAGGISIGDASGTGDVILWRSASDQLLFLTGRLVPRVTSQTGNAPTWTVSSTDSLVVTSITGTVNIGTNMTAGTQANCERKHVALTGNGTHSITWPSLFEASNTVALPTALAGSGIRMDVDFVYNTATSKFRCINVA